MSQSLTMDPDMPIPSIESHEPPLPAISNTFTAFRNTTRSPRLSSSPNRTPFKTPLSQPDTPTDYQSLKSPSLVRNGRRSTPDLQTKRSSSSLSVSRGQTPSKSSLRRVSSNLNPASTTIDMKSTDTPPRTPTTAASVAKDFFQRELQSHSSRQSKTVVIIHDSCYGHRFSRPRTSKAALSTIVERPERIHATLLGASNAYVRLGGRHADDKHGPHPDKDVNTLPRPPFLLKKTSRFMPLNHPAVTHVHGSKWMEELQIMCDLAESKLAMNGKELQRPIGYGKDEDGNNLPKLHEGDLYLCSESLSALQGCLGGVCEAVDNVFSSSETQRAFVCIRPPGHHCSSNYPSGFCWLNNVHVGISYAAMNHSLTHAAIIDFDLHHGDGSQTITWEHNSKAQNLPKNAPSHKRIPIGYYSLHDINSYPCEWGDEEKVRSASLCIENAHGQSIWNVHLEPWTSLDHFWKLYEGKYRILLDKAKTFLQHQSDKMRAAGIEPKAAIFFSAGFDASQWEGQGMQRHNVNVPTEFYARITSDVVRLAAEPQLGVDGRIISVLEGGYSDRALTSGVLSHLCGLSDESAGHVPVAGDIEHLSIGLGGLSHAGLPTDASPPLYNAQWWDEVNLGALEGRATGNIPPLPVTKEKVSGNYTSPTQASTARMTDVARERKSINTYLEARFTSETTDYGPPPSVDWVIASYELSRILIPSDRQTMSCRHDELNAEATKARRERQSAIGVAVAEPRMQLRTRAKGPNVEPENLRAASRTSNRRTTIAAVSELPDPSMPVQRPRRRSSAASSILSSFQDMKLGDSDDLVQNPLERGQKGSGTSQPDTNQISKRAKMPPPTRKAAARVSSPRKPKGMAQPVPRAASLRDKLDGVKAQSPTSEIQTHSDGSPNINHKATDTNAIDELANGFKKVSIKLKVPTLEEHLENQRKAENAKPKKPRAVRKPPLPKAVKLKPTAAGIVSPMEQTSDVVNLGNTPAESNLQSNFNPGPESGSDAMYPYQTEDSFPPSDTQVAIQTEPPEIRSNDVGKLVTEFGTTPSMTGVRVISTAPPSAYNIVQQASSTPKKTRADLPLFTSSSPIPFAQNNHVSTEDSKDGQARSIWDVPDTPRTQ